VYRYLNGIGLTLTHNIRMKKLKIKIIKKYIITIEIIIHEKLCNYLLRSFSTPI